MKERDAALRRFKPYPAYKDSGVEWLGEIPAHWDVRKLRYSCRVDGKTVCVVSCQRSPEPVFLRWKGLDAGPEGDFFVRSGPGTVKLSAASARQYIRTRFTAPSAGTDPPAG